MKQNVKLPRERNLARVRSIYSRSVRKAGTACREYRENPNPGTLARKRDRVLGAIAQRYKVAFVRKMVGGNLHGAAKTATVRKAARQYREALKVWAAHYDRENGWDATVRLT